MIQRWVGLIWFDELQARAKLGLIAGLRCANPQLAFVAWRAYNREKMKGDIHLFVYRLLCYIYFIKQSISDAPTGTLRQICIKARGSYVVAGSSYVPEYDRTPVPD